jgi:hypothetical protein
MRRWKVRRISWLYVSFMVVLRLPFAVLVTVVDSLFALLIHYTSDNSIPGP